MKTGRNVRAMQLIGVVSLWVFCLLSCTKMDYYYKDLIQLGDRTYIGKPDTIWAFSGRGRVKLAWATPVDPEAHRAIVYWNGYNDSAITPIDHAVDTGFILIGGLAEGKYTFNMVTADENGNISLPVEKVVEVFGDGFLHTLRGRTINHTVILKDSVIVFWNEDVVPQMVRTELSYTNKQGSPTKIVVSNTEGRTSIKDMDVTKEIAFRSIFIPEAQTLDTFSTEDLQEHVENLQLHTLVLEGVGSTTADFIDLSMVTVHDYDYASAHAAAIDIVHMRGNSSHQNLIAVTNEAGFAAFSSSLRDDIRDWPVHNACEMINLGSGVESGALYDALDETDREAMKAAFDAAMTAHSPSGRLTSIETGDVILLQVSDRNIYAAIKAIVSGDEGNLTIGLKISRF